MWWRKKDAEPVTQAPKPKPRREVRVSSKEFTEYRLEVTRYDGGSHAHVFTTRISADGFVVGSAFDDLQNFMQLLNTRNFVLVGSEIIREKDIKCGRIEPYKITHEIKEWVEVKE